MVILITGCSSGFGLLTALSFAERGDTVVATMRNLEKAGDLKAAARERDLTLDIRALDVTDDASVTDCVAAVRDAHGTIDVLVNNAGVGGRSAVEMFAEEDIRAIFEANVFGVLRVTRAVLPMMRAQKSGTIVTVSSISAFNAQPFNGAYSASKHAIEAFCEAMSQELKPFNVRIRLVAPGYFRTNIGENVAQTTHLNPQSPYADAEHAALAGAQTAVADGGDPQEVADTIVEAALDATGRLRWALGGGSESLVKESPYGSSWRAVQRLWSID
jgi:NAD(P)-dependent dehydrogenase (short-subunit alcohol dehydrogenase family)